MSGTFEDFLAEEQHRPGSSSGSDSDKGLT